MDGGDEARRKCVGSYGSYLGKVNSGNEFIK